MVIFKHENPNGEHHRNRPYVSRNEAGCFCDFGKWGMWVNFMIDEGDEVYMIIYNNDTIIRTMVWTTSYPSWDTKDLNIADHGLSLYGAHKVYRHTGWGVSSIWYGSDDISLLQSDTDLQNYARNENQSLVNQWIRFDPGLYSHFRIERVFHNGPHGQLPYSSSVMPQL